MQKLITQTLNTEYETKDNTELKTLVRLTVLSYFQAAVMCGGPLLQITTIMAKHHSY